jgi:PKD repeat protein
VLFIEVNGQNSNAIEHRAQVVRPDHHDISPPLRDLNFFGKAKTRSDFEPKRTESLGNSNPKGADPLAATSFTTTAASVSPVNSFDGVPVDPSYRVAPPDTNGAVGATQYVQWVNLRFAVFDKATGTMAAGFPKQGNAIWAGFADTACANNNDGDPIVQYDKAANRWILTQFSVSTTPYKQCVAVSTTSDATGTYARYSYSYSSNFNDYPKVGVWPDGYYITYNMFQNGAIFIGARACAFDRAAMLAGAPATQQCFQLSSSYGSLLPSDLDGATAPPAGTPNLLLNIGSTSPLRVWKFHVDWVNPANTTLTGPTNITVASFSRACGGGTCIPQPGTTNQLDSLADRLMYRLAYRNFGDHEALVVNHSVSSGSVSGIRWYELRNPSGGSMASGTPVLYQQGTFQPDSIWRWMGSATMDKVGNIAIGYSISSSGQVPSIRFAFREPGDALGALGNETFIFNGGGSQTSTLHRWGDYSSISVDPVDDCTLWYTTEYLPANGSFNWNTRISNFKFSTCGGSGGNTPPVASFTYSCTNLSCTFTDTSTDSDGTVNGWSWNFGDGGTSPSQNPSHTYGAGGNYSVSLIVTDNGGATNTSTQNVIVTAPSTGITLSATGYKVKGLQKADLSWSGATTPTIDVYRTGAFLTNTANDGFHTDNINARGSGSYTYKVCETGGGACSNTVNVIF